MDRIWAQCQKELAQFRRDRLAAALAFLLPVMTLLIFGFAVRLEIKDVPLVVMDYEHSPLSRSYIEQVFATNQFQPVQTGNRAPIEAIDRGLAKAAIVIPCTFSRDVQAGRMGEIQVVLDGTDVNNARVIQNTIRAVTQSFVARTNPASAVARVVAQVRIWFNPGRREVLYIVPGVYAVVLFTYPAVLAAMAFVRERDQGTFVQVCSSDLGAAEFLLGKCLAYFIVGVGQAALLMGIGAGLFGVWLAGSPIPLLVGTVLYLIGSILFGLLMGVRAKRAIVAIQNVMNTGFLSAVWLSGFIYPVENIPFPLSLASRTVAARYYIELTRDAFLVGAGWSRIWTVLL
ncbi:MAG TPA: ABC transporter permease, partial [Elainellaceae cyanobacterium]